MDYYERKKRAGLDLQEWLNNAKRGKWSLFSRLMLVRYGFSPASMLRLLEAAFPEFTIEDDELAVKK
jgi:hypothetical protein